MKKSTFKDLLQDPNKKRGEATNELATMFRKMLAEHGILPTDWDRRAELYYRKLYTNHRGETDMIKVNQEKSNLTRALTKNSIPWKRFTTALAILGPETWDLEITLPYKSGHVRKHKVTVKNRYVDLGPELDDDEEDYDDDE